MWEPPQRLVHESLLASAEAVPDRDAIVDQHFLRRQRNNRRWPAAL